MKCQGLAETFKSLNLTQLKILHTQQATPQSSTMEPRVSHTYIMALHDIVV